MRRPGPDGREHPLVAASCPTSSGCARASCLGIWRGPYAAVRCSRAADVRVSPPSKQCVRRAPRHPEPLLRQQVVATSRATQSPGVSVATASSELRSLPGSLIRSREGNRQPQQASAAMSRLL